MPGASKPSTKKRVAKSKAKKASGSKSIAPQKARKPAVLPKSEGDAGVQSFIASMEPWQAAIARRVDALVVELVPDVRKFVKWRVPMYGVKGQGLFLAFSGFNFHINFTFFRGTALNPVPPVGKQKDARMIQVRESDPFDEKQWISWIKQASSMPGWDGGSPRQNGGLALKA